VSWPVETTTIGRIVRAPEVPEGYALFYTTRDYDGAIGEALGEVIGGDAPISHCHQVHGAAVARVPRHPERSEGSQNATDRIPRSFAVSAAQDDGGCDALWSDRPSVLAIKVADCLPISLIEPEHGVIANVHSGWRGAVQRIADATLDAITVPFDPARAIAWLGPTIRVCCFEVGEEVVEQFRAAYPDADAFVDRSRAKPHVDVPALTASALRARGVGRVLDSGLCTRCDGSIFHSFRRDGKGGGRNLAIVAKR
jgi:YfiH family protein